VPIEERCTDRGFRIETNSAWGADAEIHGGTSLAIVIQMPQNGSGGPVLALRSGFMNRLISFGKLPLLMLGLGFCSGAAVAQTYITLDYPGGFGTVLSGVDGNNIVGTDNSLPGGFLYNGSTFTSISDPLAGSQGTSPAGISGNNVVGCYYDPTGNLHGFIYTVSTSAYTTLNDPSAPSSTSGGIVGTVTTGISGNNVVGFYWDSSDTAQGFLFNLSTSAYTTLRDPFAAYNQFPEGTCPEGISGNYVAGLYRDSADRCHGFVYNIANKSYTTLDDPLVGGQMITTVTGIDGDTVFGCYTDTSNYYQPFLFDILTDTYTTLNSDPWGPIWLTGGISGNTIVGTYTDSNDISHGFVATIPEPSTLALLGVWAMGLAVYGLWRRKQERISLVGEPTLSGQDETDGPAILSMPFRWTETARKAA
jgi:hypothetical protein